MQAPDAGQLQALMDRQAITELLYRYSRAVDRMDHALGYSVWHEDGTADYGAGMYDGSGRGFIDWVCDSHAPMIAHSHQITSMTIELQGDRAGSEAYVTAALRFMSGEQLTQMTVRGRYLDRWSRRDGRWGIDHRVYAHDFDDVRAVTASGLASPGRRDRSDPSYAVLADTVLEG